MKKAFSIICTALLFWACFLFSINSYGQKSISNKIPTDSLDRYGCMGLRSGIFYNLTDRNQFSMPLLGTYIDLSFGKFRHSIELDFLTRKPFKIFKNAYSPCFTYHFALKTGSFKKIDIHPGIFVNCRKDVLTRNQYFYPNDTTFSYAKSGFHTVFSIGPSLELSRKVFLPKNWGFLMLGARISYSFDLLAYGTQLDVDNSLPLDTWKKIKYSDRFQRDVFVVSLKIGWGKLTSSKIEAENFDTEESNE